MEEQVILESIGLSKNEAKLYLELLSQGTVTTTPLIKKTGINASKVYESLNRLLKKGLASYKVIKNAKHWQAEDPKRIKDYLEDEKKKIDKKKEQVEQILLTLEEKKEEEATVPKYSIYEGIRGIKSARENALKQLKEGETFYLILTAYPKDKKMEGYWLDFQKRRAKKGIHCKYIFNEELKQLWEARKKNPLTQARFVKSDILSPIWTEIYTNHVGIGVMTDRPSLFVIKNKEIARGYINYFNSLWQTGEKK